MKDIHLSTVEEVGEAVRGHQILDVTIGHGGLHIELSGGRFLVIPDAKIIAVCSMQSELH